MMTMIINVKTKALKITDEKKVVCNFQSLHQVELYNFFI